MMFVGAGSCVGVGRNSSTIPIVENLRGVILHLPLFAPFQSVDGAPLKRDDQVEIVSFSLVKLELKLMVTPMFIQ